jgi:phage baseplate assembly protein W
MPVFSKKFIGVTLPIRLGQTGMFEQSLTVIEQTRSNVKNLILTKKGERLPPSQNLGCDIWKIIFEPLTPEIFEQARNSVVEAFREFLPYLELVDFNVEQQLPDENLISIQIVYRFLNNPNVIDSVIITNINNLGTQLTTLESSGSITTRQKNVRGSVRGVAPMPPSSLG